MDPAVIVALVGIGIIFIIIIIIWFMAGDAHKKTKYEFRSLLGAAFAYHHNITEIFMLYSNYIMDRNPETREKIEKSIDEWVIMLNGLIHQAEISIIKHYMMSKIDVDNLEQTINLNNELVNDLNYLSKSDKQGILRSMNNLDEYLYKNQEYSSAKIRLFVYQVGVLFAGSLGK